MPSPSPIAAIFRSRPFLLIAGLAGIVLIALADRSLNTSIPLGLLYLAPIAVMSTVLSRWHILLLGALCTAVAEYSDAFPWTLAEGIPRDALYFFAYTAAGLYISELLHRHRAELLHTAAIQAEMEARRGVEEQLRLLVQNSSLAIVTSDESGTILQANDAARQLFLAPACETQPQNNPAHSTLEGKSISSFMPSLARVQIRRHGWEQLRTMMQCQAFRVGPIPSEYHPFLADVWFSSYMTSCGGRLTAMIVDSSIEIRDREEANLEQVLVGSRLAIGAMSHEIRNICAAISVVEQNVQQNLARMPASALPEPQRAETQKKELDALRQLVAALERVASVELSLVKRQPSTLPLDRFLRDLYIVVHASLQDAGIHLEWNIQPNLPSVRADQQSLLQVFLNLLRNAETALQPATHPCLAVTATCTVAPGRGEARVHILVADNGPGVAHPGHLFRPFAPESGASTPSLGLFLSRAMMRSFHGDLRHQPTPTGAAFLVDLVAAEPEA